MGFSCCALIFGCDQEDIGQMISDSEIYEDDRGVKREQRRVQDLLSSLNRLSATLFAAIGVAEQQIAILQDLHCLFLASCRTKIQDYEKRCSLRQNPFYKNITLSLPSRKTLSRYGLIPWTLLT